MNNNVRIKIFAHPCSLLHRLVHLLRLLFGKRPQQAGLEDDLQVALQDDIAEAVADVAAVYSRLVDEAVFFFPDDPGKVAVALYVRQLAGLHAGHVAGLGLGGEYLDFVVARAPDGDVLDQPPAELAGFDLCAVGRHDGDGDAVGQQVSFLQATAGLALAGGEEEQQKSAYCRSASRQECRLDGVCC